MNRQLTRRGAIEAMGVAGAAAALGWSGPARAANDLIVPSYPGRYERFWRDKLIPDFEAKTGVKTTLDVAANAVAWAAGIRAAGPETPSFSFVMMNEVVGSILRSEGYFEPWPIAKVPNLKHVHPKARNEDYNGVAFMISPIGIAYRTDVVKAPPKSWKALWEAPFKGKVGLFAINNSAGFMSLMAFSQVYGKNALDFDAGLAAVERLKPFPQGDLAGALSTLLTRGEIVACPLDVSEVINLKNRGVQVGFAVPEEGMFMFDQTLSLMKHGPNKDAACQYLDFMLGEDVQKKLAEEFFYVPVNTTVKLPPALAAQFPITIADVDKLMQFDWVAATKERDKVTESWNRLTR